MIRNDQIKFISKKMSYALRHNPDKYGIILDEEGFTDLGGFLNAMNRMHRFNPPLTKEDIAFVIGHSDKKRFEMTDNKIRALYGHSVTSVIIHKRQSDPPDVLYHGTARRFIESIMREGLLPMRRQYVHLSADVDTAMQVGRRRDSRPVVLRIDARKACGDGIRFYVGNESVWLSEPLPPEYLEVITQEDR